MASNSVNVLGLIIAFIFLINLGAFSLVMTYGIMNDELLYTVVDLSEELDSNGLLPTEFTGLVSSVANKFKDTFEIWDTLLFIFYLLFIASTFVLSYVTDKENYFSFFGTLFFVGMIFLFIISLFVTFSDWWNASILVAVLPIFQSIFPKYGWIMSKIGLFSAIQLSLCLLINMLDFDLASMTARKKKEQTTIDNEVL